MEKFNWTDAYSVHVEEIDEQHRHFFEIANELIGLAENDPADKEHLFALLGKLGNYALYHLSTEEEYFEKYDYPDVAPHIAAHESYRTAIKQYLEDVRAEDADVPALAKKAAFYSSSWLAEHITGMDQRYSAFFNERGLK